MFHFNLLTRGTALQSTSTMNNICYHPIFYQLLWSEYVRIEDVSKSITLGTGMANQTTEHISVLPRRIVAIATLYTSYLYHETMRKVEWIGEMRLR